ncbi:MAG: ABC transporter permease [Oscillospiraceae bacterium]|jgi:ABC-2 type transport system permease protein|nr:ABC transporter permease [Oscillospiraceae bacterium]
MNQVFTVAAFTLRDGVRKKAFLVTNIILVLTVLVAAFLLPRIGNSAGGEEPTDGDTSFADEGVCYLLDASGGAIPDAAQALELGGFSVTELQSAAQMENAREKIKDDEADIIIHILPGGDAPELEAYTKDMLTGASVSVVAELLNDAWRTARLRAAGVPEGELALVLPGMPLRQLYVDNAGVSNLVAGGALMFLMFFAIYYYGMSVAMSVATEKSSRVMETLIVSARPGRILLGKCLGSGALGLLQFAGLILFAVGSVKLFIPASVELPFALPQLRAHSVILILLYFILGYALFALLNSVCGAMVSKMEDLNAALMPVTLITMASFYGGYFTNLAGGLSGTESGGKLTLLIPFTSPFSVPFQLLGDAADYKTIAASLALLAATVILVAFISARIYAASVLHYGGRLRLKDLKGMLGKN